MAAARTRVSLWAPVAAYMAFLFALSSIANTPSVPQGMDKNIHAMLYAGLGGLTMRALGGGWRARFTLGHVVIAVLIATLYGVSDEWHQSFVPPRTSDVFDVVADAVGAAVAAVLLWTLSAVVGRRESRGV